MNAQDFQRWSTENPEAVQQAQGQYQAMLAKSATDADFRRKLVADSAAAVAEFTGKPVPENFNVRFIDAQGTPTVVLPDAVDTSAELSENELESVAGGLVWIPIAAALLGAFVAGATSPD